MKALLHPLTALSAIGLTSILAAACATGRAEEQPVTVLPAPAAPTRGFITDIEQATVQNEFYRRVLFTGPRTQLVLMSLRPGEEIGKEMHANTDQFLRVEAGTGYITMNGESYQLQDGTAVVIPAGVSHNVVNNGSTPLRFYVLYSPPAQPSGAVYPTKREADAAARHDRYR